MRKDLHYTSKRPTFPVDTFEKAKAILDAKSYSRHAEQVLEYMFEMYPQLAKCTHQHIADVMILQRETVSRTMTKLKKRGKIPILQVAMLIVILLTSSVFAASYVITSIPTGTWFFVATAYDADGNESSSSNEVSKYITDGQAVLSWGKPRSYTDDSPLLKMSGYKIYWGDTSGVYTFTQDVKAANEIQNVGVGQPIQIKSGAGRTTVQVK